MNIAAFVMTSTALLELLGGICLFGFGVYLIANIARGKSITARWGEFGEGAKVSRFSSCATALIASLLGYGLIAKSMKSRFDIPPRCIFYAAGLFVAGCIYDNILSKWFRK